MSRVAIFSGNFDPITYGHLDIIVRASQLFDKLIVVVVNNNNRKYLIPLKDRADLVREAIKEMGCNNVEVDICSGKLLASYALSNNVKFLVRGVRNSEEYTYESNLRTVNNGLGDTDTIFLASQPYFAFISSEFVREIYYNNGDTSKLVPECVDKYLKNLYNISMGDKS